MTRFAYFKGRIVPAEQATISVKNHAFNYGTAVFGGLRGYWNADDEQLYVFRPLDHFRRLIQSASLLRMTVPHTPEGLEHILIDLLRAEGYRENVYVRPLVYKDLDGIGVRLHDVPDALTIWTLPFGKYIEKEEGAHVHFSAWRRVDDNAIPARGKISGSYANSALIKSDAVLAGYDEALVLNQDGHVSEASAANIFMARNGTVFTPPVQSNVLEGITRRSLIELLRNEMGVDVVERDIDRTEIYLADEVFLCGTGVQIAAITRVEHRAIGSGRMGEITNELRTLYQNVVTARVEKYRKWCAPVYATEPMSES
ncbi:MAG: branched-chain amino acid transaminase [Anaerolineae bacterium]|nr:MAG: branched-chain amino acid aminotransferase [Chloroflexi bacterium OLB13]MBC6956200.1 branched-chain amino acid transaminase [Chloroflexota bacterium]MBV6436186.1 Branched-chain-amino-acid aminotransferase [Anaerolineae bacterium]MDL1915024.1 branched-chain amino acid transaminase [Anaerolineae bacterium CFX4]MBW7879629.1 branched-chain amino acid transaminase [Anaerolineae bacterium]